MLVARDRAMADTKYGPVEGREPVVPLISALSMRVSIKEISLTLEV